MSRASGMLRPALAKCYAGIDYNYSSTLLEDATSVT